MDIAALFIKIWWIKQFLLRPEVLMSVLSALRGALRSVMVASLAFGVAGPARADISPFSQSLAVAAGEREDIAAFYALRDYAPVWTGATDSTRRNALLAALSGAADHGLPIRVYDPADLVAGLRAAETEGDRGRMEYRMTQAFLAYVRDMKMGVVVPAKVDAGIRIERPDYDAVGQLQAFLLAPSATAYFQSLVPRAPEYAQLMAEKRKLERVLANGGWGTAVLADALEPGATGAPVVALRDRMMAMGYLGRSVTGSYDHALQGAVQRFQVDHGLTADGTAGAGTMAEINLGADARLQSVMVAMERLRWTPDMDLGARHIWVNLPDFTAKIVDHGRVTFSTRAVIGANEDDRRTPEFSDQMEYFVVNPSWSVPRSITVKEYLPLLQRNPNAVGHLNVVDGNGRVVPRGAVNFAAYTARNFPFALRQAPSDGNALGKVKFMFPNPYNIYLHDTPSKDLFNREVRAFSHGCIRLGSPIDFAHAILAVQSADPVADFDRLLVTGQESSVVLQDKVPVHLVYFTAFPGPRGTITYRRDIYGRDAAIWAAMVAAGVALPGVQG
jgi:L,D-transpeptidase YcbB